MSQYKSYFFELNFVFLLIITHVSYAQDAKTRLFNEVTASLHQAQNEYAHILCPKEFRKAYMHYLKAKELDDESKRYEDIKTELEYAVEAITLTNEINETRENFFAKVLLAREKALIAEADKFTNEFWKTAEEDFNEVIEDYADKDYDEARKKLPSIIMEYEKAKKHSEYARNLIYNWQPLQLATSSNALMLANDEYTDGINLLEKAIISINDGDELTDVRKIVDEAAVILNKSENSSLKFSQRYPELIKSRNDALEVEAESFAFELFQEADLELQNTANTFHAGNIAKTVKLSAETTQKYLSAKHASLKKKIFSDAQRLVETSEEEDLFEFASKTFAESQNLIEKGYASIESDTYEIENLQQLEKEAKDKANLAIEIAQIINAVESGTTTWENLILDWKDLLKKQNQQDVQYILPQKKSNEIPKEVYALFNEDEAEIIDNGMQIIIRLINLEFSWLGYILTSSHKQYLEKAKSALEYFPTNKITVASYNDYVAADRFNASISQLRAENIRTYILENSSIDSNRITAIGYGETRPITEDKSIAGRKRNIRTEFIIEK